MQKAKPLTHGIKDTNTQRAVRELERTTNTVVGRVNELATQTAVAVDLAEIHAALVRLKLISED